MRNQQNVKVKVNSTFETICPFPVGYVYMSQTNTSPGSIYGGTWSSITGGRYMRAAGAWGNGGSNTITVDQMPAHSHALYGWNNAEFASSAGGHGEYITRLAGQDYARNTSAAGGGNRSIPLTKTFGRGTELPKLSKTVEVM